jgi:hypothetical protein
MTIACGELGHHIKDFCRSHQVDLVICGKKKGMIMIAADHQIDLV